MDIIEEVNKIFSDLSEWKVGDYVAVAHKKSWFPGKIINLHDDGSADVSCMLYADHFQRENKFRWPKWSEGDQDTPTYKKEELLLKLDEPQPVGSNKRLQYFKITDDDFADASDILRLILRN